VAEHLCEGLDGEAGADGDDELLGAVVRLDLAKDSRSDVRLDSENDDVGEVHDLDVVHGSLDTEGAGELVELGLISIGNDNLVLSNDTRVDKTTEESGTHLATTNKTDRLVERHRNWGVKIEDSKDDL
jgi:hypothetical protein